MKWYFFFLMNLVVSFSAVGDSPWFFAHAMNGVQFWKNQAHKDCRIVVDEQTMGSNKPIEFYQSKVYQDDLQARKKSALSFFGVDRWNVKINKIEKISGNITVDFSGDYYDRKKQQTFYLERHVYGSKKLVQFLYTCSKNVTSSSEIIPVFESIQKSKI